MLIFMAWPCAQSNSLSFKERAGVRMGLLPILETHPLLDPPLEGEEIL
jgi:hypothetical protein